MNEIEKEIEEMSKDLKNCLPSDWFWLKTADSDAHLIAKHFYNLGYRNCKDKVVLSKEEQERLNATEKRIKQLKNEINDYKQRYASAEKRYEQLVQSSCEALAKKGKETARDFYHEIMSYIGANQKFWIVDDEHITIINVDELFDFVIELAKEYGVEVE